jgi:hypothetical protein
VDTNGPLAGAGVVVDADVPVDVAETLDCWFEELPPQPATDTMTKTANAASRPLN